MSDLTREVTLLVRWPSTYVACVPRTNHCLPRPALLNWQTADWPIGQSLHHQGKQVRAADVLRARVRTSCSPWKSHHTQRPTGSCSLSTLEMSIILLVRFGERHGSVVVSTSAWHAAGRGLIPRPDMFYCSCKKWLSTLEIVGVVAQCSERRFETWANLFTPQCLCLSDETL